MTAVSPGGGMPHPLLTLIDLGHRAREAADDVELAFLLVNDTRVLLSYRQAALWWEASGVHTLSGVIEAEKNAPYVQWLQDLCAALHREDLGSQLGVRLVDRAGQEAATAEAWGDWLPENALWVPLCDLSDAARPRPAGGLLLAGEDAFGDEAQALLTEWGSTWQYTWWARHRPSPWSWTRLVERLRQAMQRPAHLPWWRWRVAQWVIGVLCVALWPVRLTTLAPGELVPRDPAVIRAPLDGVIGHFQVVPNQQVKAGDPLFSFDEATLASRLDVARQALATAEQEYRQLAQLVLSDPKSKAQLASLLGKIEEKRTEAEFLAGQFARTQVLSPRDGMAIIDDPSEWVGRPVQTGERVMRVADPQAVEIEAWLPIADAVPLEPGAQVKLYLAASPLSVIEGQVSYIGHDALPRPEGGMAYRVRATLDSDDGQRIGLKGTAKLHGHWVPLTYWIIRRPLSTVRQYLAI